MMKRRLFLKSSLAPLVANWVPQCLSGTYGVDSNPSSQGLKDYLSNCGVVVGTQVSNSNLHQNPKLQSLIPKEFGGITAGNALTWMALRPAPDQFDFSNADKLIEWAEHAGLYVRGHNLACCDLNAEPKWFKSTLTPTNAIRFLVDHITTVVRKYPGKLASWDVVNEAVSYYNVPSHLNPHPWVDLIGEQYIDYAFHATKDADPRPVRVLNETRFETDNAEGAGRRTALLALLKRLKSRNVPVQALGFESHLPTNVPIDYKGLESFIGEVRAMGIEIYITEMDVDDSRQIGDVHARDEAIAAIYGTYLEFMLRYAQPRLITFWQASDSYNWYDWAAKSSPQAYARTDGSCHRGAPFDESMQEKAAYREIVKAFLHACR